ncbi:MAG: hypothetical protein WB440_18255 [Steroidobacteraceae bacterium]|jgi:hypothetical protein
MSTIASPVAAASSGALPDVNYTQHSGKSSKARPDVLIDNPNIGQIPVGTGQGLFSSILQAIELIPKL